MMDIEVVSNLDVGGRPLNYINLDVPELSSGVIAADPQMRELAANMSRWVDNARSAAGANTMFDRGAYLPPDNPYDEMRAARHAIKYDSVVSGVAEITEAFAFQGVKWESEDPDEADVFNQLSINMNLDAVIRKMWREEYTYGQCCVAKLWGWQEFTVRGNTSAGNKKKKKYRIWAPLQLRILDSAKIVPIGTGPLGGEGLAWQATPGEIGYYQSSYAGDVIDPLMTTYFQGTYTPSFEEAGELGRWGVVTNRLLAMNPEWVFRHTLTKPDYQRFPDIHMKSIFTLLDLKQQLMQSDRAYLIGAANYILLIRKGDKDTPATREELENLQANYNFIAKMPVIISDYRLQVDIIAPKTDMVLDADKYQTIDSRILSRLLGTLTSAAANSGRSENQETLSLSVARVMENRRHMLRRTLELELARATVNHPKNAGLFDTEPNLVYTPRNIALAMDAGYTQALMSLRQSREISRETILEFMGLDESVEALRMQIEAEFYDDIFKTEVPYTAGSPAEGVDPALDKGAANSSGALQLQVDPKSGAITAKPAAGATGATGASGNSKTSSTNTKTSTTSKTATTKAPASGKTKDGANKSATSRPTSGQPSTGRRRAGPNGTSEPSGVSGARGGRPVGGGTTSRTGKAATKPRTARGNVSTKK